MEILSTLYYDLMNKFPFSITGYNDIELRISEYFTLFCDHPLNKKNKNISFIVGLFGQLSGLDELNSETIEKINEWETERIKKFFFCNYEGDRAELAMSFYIYQLQSLMKEKYAINVLTNNFRNDIDFRISLSNDENPNFYFHRNEKVFEIKVPKSIYKDDIFKNPQETRNILREKLQRQLVRADKHSLLVKYDSIDSYELEIIEVDESTKKNNSILYEENLGREIFTKNFRQFYDSNKNFILSDFSTSLVEESIFKNKNVEIEELFKIAYAGSFLCAYYGVNLEYILSTCRTVEKRSYGLGGLAVGVKSEFLFPDSNRAFYKIISNQIASNLSGQILYNLFSSEVYKEKASTFLSKLCDTGSAISRLTHGVAEVDFFKYKKEAISKISDIRNKKIIHKDTFEKAISLIEGIDPKLEIPRETKDKLEKLFRWKLGELAGKYFQECFPGAQIVLNENLNDTISYHFDFGWLVELMIRIPYANFKKHVLSPSPKLIIEVDAVDKNGNIISNKGLKSHYLRIRMKDNGQGMNLMNDIKNSAGSFRLIHKGSPDYEVLQTHGNIYIYSKGKSISILELSKNKALKDSSINEGTIFEILLKENVNEITCN